MKPKPILVIELQKGTSCDVIKDVYESINPDMLNEYHVLACVNSDSKTAFNVFYEKDFNEVKYEELKKIIKDKINGK